MAEEIKEEGNVEKIETPVESVGQETKTDTATEGTASSEMKEEVKEEVKEEEKIETPIMATEANKPTSLNTAKTETVTPPVVPEVKETPVVPPVVTETKVTETKTEFTEFQSLIQQIKNSGTQAQKRLVGSFEKYIERMSPGIPVDEEKGAQYQYTFWRAIRRVIEDEEHSEFKNLWSLILAYFKEYEKTIFNERYVFRFSEFWVNDQKELAAFQRILNIIKVTADPATRQNSLKQVNISRSLAEGVSDAGRGKLLSYYNL